MIPLHAKVCPEAFPIKASGKPEVIHRGYPEKLDS